MRRLLLIAVSTTLIAASTQAQVIDAAKNFADLDGIAARCIITTRYTYAKTMCDHLEAQAQKIAEKNNITYDFTGRLIRPPVKRGKRTPVPALTSDNLKKPLLLEFLVKGTKTPRVGASISIMAYLEYRNAVEKDSSAGLPRSGKLMMWRRDIVGYGPARRLGPALAKAMRPGMREIMEAFASATRKNGAHKGDQTKP